MPRYSFSICLLFLLLSAVGCGKSQPDSDPEVIPAPLQVSRTDGAFSIPEEWSISIPPGSEEAKLVKDYFAESFNVIEGNEVQPLLNLELCDTLPHEAYRMTIDNEGVVIQSSKSGSGWFYGIQTLIQLLLHSDSASLQGMVIEDQPRFPWRGAMMDHGRWFLGKEETLRFIDLMALYKLNVLHLHLTDDQGWRIEIDRYPRLTEVGSKRPYTQIGHSDDSVDATFDGVPHGGFFTKDDIREILDYARSRFITVVPEIEMPGHASAALAAYPEYSCGLGKTYIVQPEFDVFDEVFCPTDSTLAFLRAVLDEVIDLFPSDYIHIGGDECPKKAWKVCEKCQKRIHDLGLEDEDQLQSWMISEISRHVASRGRHIIGWDEILEGGIAPDATVMSWRGIKGGISAAMQSHQAIMTPQAYCYLDYYQEDPATAPLAMGGFTPLDSVYLYEPVPHDIPDSLRHFIIGIQGNVWGEYIPDSPKFEYMAFPRLIALSEVAWSSRERKSLDSFHRRLRKEYKRLDSLGIKAFRPDFIDQPNTPL